MIFLISLVCLAALSSCVPDEPEWPELVDGIPNHIVIRGHCEQIGDDLNYD